MIGLVSSTVYVGSIEGQEVRLQIHGETFPERKQHHDYVPEDVDVHRNIVLNTGVKTPITLPGGHLLCWQTWSSTADNISKRKQICLAEVCEL